MQSLNDLDEDDIQDDETCFIEKGVNVMFEQKLGIILYIYKKNIKIYRMQTIVISIFFAIIKKLNILKPFSYYIFTIISLF